MSRLRRAPLVLLAALLAATPAAAQIAGHPFEVSAGAGLLHFDSRTQTKDAPGYAAGLGWRAQPWLSFEGAGLYSASKADFGSEPQRKFFYGGLDLRWNLRSAEGRAVPFLLTGMGYGFSQWVPDPAAPLATLPVNLDRGSGSIGLGMLLNLGGSQRSYLRFQVRDVLFQERQQSELSNHVGVTAGLQYVLGGKARDQDHDGVRDGLDQCPNTPLGAKVDARGCPIDSDGDGVYDGLDKCPNTPHGCKVDANGCPSDVDGDGVCDGLDLCPNTPAGLRVDAHGCPIEVSEKEVQLLDTGLIRLGNIRFDTGKATLKPESFAVLDSLALILQQYPTLRIEVGGHTDNVGSPQKNQPLSEERARSVFDYLRAKVAGFDSLGWTAKGYGSGAPIAPNTTALGKAKNRRVEFKVLNTQALRIEREKRRFLRTGEGLPPATAPPDTTRR